jgi:hypothetical protein
VPHNTQAIGDLGHLAEYENGKLVTDHVFPISYVGQAITLYISVLKSYNNITCVT